MGLPSLTNSSTSKGRTFLELGKQTMSSAEFQAEHLLRSLNFDSSTFCSVGHYAPEIFKM